MVVTANHSHRIVLATTILNTDVARTYGTYENAERINSDFRI